MAIRTVTWNPGECTCKFVLSYDDRVVPDGHEWEDHYADYVLVPSTTLSDGTRFVTSICPAHQGVPIADVFQTCHIESKKHSAAIRSLRQQIPGLHAAEQAENKVSGLQEAITVVWSGSDKNRRPLVRVHPALRGRGLINASHLTAAKVAIEAQFGTNTVDVDTGSV